MPLEKWIDRFKESDADELSIAFDLIKEAGARHSAGDMAKLQTIHDHTIALGASCPKMEAAVIELVGDVIPLREGAVGQDGTAYLKLIQPGWGSSGFYSAELLKRDGPKVFKSGLKNFWNHQTPAEELARPEGDLRDLASVLTEDAHYEDSGPAGPGLYAKARVFDQFRQPVDDLAKHIGVSIRAAGRAKEGEIEGKKGVIIEHLTRGISADYVTTPGAGGKILQLFEAARGRTSEKGENHMDDDALKRLIESAVSGAVAPLQAEVKYLREELDRPKPAEAIRRHLTGIRLPDAAKERIVNLLSNSVPLTESKAIDDAKLKPLVESAAKDEAVYIESMGYGRVAGLGTAVAPESETLKEADVLKESEKIFGRLMGNEKAGAVAARGRMF